MIVGIDEVGRGCLAGPVVVGAVLLGNHTIQGLADSKQLTAKQRHKLARHIRQQADAIGIGWISPQLIDRHGMAWALRQAAQIAVRHITVPYREIIIDGTIRLIDNPCVTTLKKADALIPTVSAAAIVAKVARDQYMHKMHTVFPHYGFASHVGYATRAHRHAITHYGTSPLHRISYIHEASTTLTSITESLGRRAEGFAKDYLEKHGYTTIAQNWKTPTCEIDLIMQKDTTLYFVEVKYRKTTRAGDGRAAITPQKLARMRRAATVWRRQYNTTSLTGMQLAAIAVEGDPMVVKEWLPLVGD